MGNTHVEATLNHPFPAQVATLAVAERLKFVEAANSLSDPRERRKLVARREATCRGFPRGLVACFEQFGDGHAELNRAFRATSTRWQPAQLHHIMRDRLWREPRWAAYTSGLVAVLFLFPEVVQETLVAAAFAVFYGAVQAFQAYYGLTFKNLPGVVGSYVAIVAFLLFLAWSPWRRCLRRLAERAEDARPKSRRSETSQILAIRTETQTYEQYKAVQIIARGILAYTRRLHLARAAKARRSRRASRLEDLADIRAAKG